MKFEIDFGKPEALRQMKRELEAALAGVNRALEVFDRSAAQQPAPAPSVTSNSPTADPASNAPATSVENIFTAAPTEFTSKQMIDASNAANIPETRMRRYLKELVEINRITLLEQGQGRRPSRYRKN